MYVVLLEFLDPGVVAGALRGQHLAPLVPRRPRHQRPGLVAGLGRLGA